MAFGAFVYVVRHLFDYLYLGATFTFHIVTSCFV